MSGTHRSEEVHGRKIFGLRLVNRFGKSEDGVAALEFGMVVMPFLMLLFAILETSVGFFASQVFETAVDRASRQIRTGQITSKKISISNVRKLISNATYSLMSEHKVKLDVKTMAVFPAAPLVTPRDENNDLDYSKMGYNTGGAGSIVIVRAYYEWPVFLDYLWQSSTSLSRGSRLFVATMAFKNEPFS